MNRVAMVLLSVVVMALMVYAIRLAFKPAAVAVPEVVVDKADLENKKRFDAALETLKSGDDPDAIKEMRRLAVLDPPYVPAQRYLVTRMIKRGDHMADDGRRRNLIKHLEIIAEGDDVEAKASLAQLYVASGDQDRGIEMLRDVVGRRPDMRPLLARLLILKGEHEQATAVAESAVAHYRRQLTKDEHNPSMRLALASSLGILNRTTEAIEVLEAGTEEFPELHKAVATYTIRHVDQRWAQGKTDLETGRLLRDVLQQDPTNLTAWSRVYQLSIGEGGVAEFASDMIRESTEARNTEGGLELTLGSHAFAEGDTEKAVSLLEIAYEQSPTRPEILNNLAWYLTKKDPPQLDRAIELADQLVEQQPQKLEYRETRGQILALLGRDKEAMDDLRQALRAMPRYEPLIETLASLYEKGGDEISAIALRERITGLAELQADETAAPAPADWGTVDWNLIEQQTD